MSATTTARTVLRVLLPILVIALAFVALRALSKLRTPPARRPAEAIAEPVSVVNPLPLDGPVQLAALGTVTPAREVGLQSEVTGRIVEVDPRFVPGGRVAAGEVVVTLDNRDHALQIKQAQSQVKQAEVALQQEQSRQTVAEREWKLMGDPTTAASARGRALALREPQIAGAQAQVTAAESALAQARLAHQRTHIAAPFNAIVRNESVDIGQIARPGTPLGTLVGSDAWWVQVSLPASELRWLDIPGSEATVIQSFGDAPVRRAGTVVRMLADVDPSGQMARVIVEVPDPLGLQDPTAGALLLGATVTVELTGRRLDDAVALPRSALRGDDAVWLVAPDDTLAITPVRVARRERDRVLITGLAADARVINNRIAAPVAGMKLRPTAPGLPAPATAQEATR